MVASGSLASGPLEIDKKGNGDARLLNLASVRCGVHGGDRFGLGCARGKCSGRCWGALFKLIPGERLPGSAWALWYELWVCQLRHAADLDGLLGVSGTIVRVKLSTLWYLARQVWCRPMAPRVRRARLRLWSRFLPVRFLCLRVVLVPDVRRGRQCRQSNGIAAAGRRLRTGTGTADALRLVKRIAP
jgi:hypothetical protein